VGAEVEVDPETGQVKVRRLVTAVDSGVIINPYSFLSQVEGGVVTGLGYALMEEIPLEDGRPVAAHLGDYKLPSIADLPDHEPLYILEPAGYTPYGGKGIGETTNSPPAPAIANAIADASGVRVTSLPLSAEKVYKALKTGRGR